MELIKSVRSWLRCSGKYQKNVEKAKKKRVDGDLTLGPYNGAG